LTLAGLLVFAPCGAGLAQNAVPGAPQSPGGGVPAPSGAGPAFPAPAPTTTMGQLPHANPPPPSPPPVSRNRGDCVKTNCVDNGGGNFTADAQITTRQDHASIYLSGVTAALLDFNRADGPMSFAFHSASGAAPDFRGDDFYDEVYAEGPGGQVLIARVATGVHVFGADCVFSGLFQDGKTSPPPFNRKTVSTGKTITLFDSKEFRVVGTCVDNGGGSYAAEAFLIAKQDNGMWQEADNPGIGDLDFDKADAPVRFPNTASGAGPVFVAGDFFNEVVAVAADGKMLIARVGTGVHRSADCTFSGLFTNSKSDFTRDLTLVPAGTAKVLWDDSQFQVIGTCVDNGGGSLTAQSSIVTKSDNAMLFVSSAGTPVLDFDSTDPPYAFDTSAATGAAPQLMARDYYSEIYAVAASGRVLIARVVTAVHVLGGGCGFAGRFQD